MSDLTQRIRETIRDIPDFPIEGIIFKDITPILSNPDLFNQVIDDMVGRFAGERIDASLRAAPSAPARDGSRRYPTYSPERVGARRDAGPDLQGPLGPRVAESKLGRVPPVAHALALPAGAVVCVSCGLGDGLGGGGDPSGSPVLVSYLMSFVYTTCTMCTTAPGPRARWSLMSFLRTSGVQRRAGRPLRCL